MDTRHPTDYVKMLYDRVQKYEPELVSKVIGYVLLHDNCHHEVIRLALGPDDEIHSIIDKAKYAIYRMQSSPVEHIHDIPHNLSSSQSHLIPWPPFMTSPWQPDHILDKFQLTTSRYRTVQKHPEIPSNKPCHYHSKGYCRHGVNCRYFHGQQVSPDSNEQPHQPHTSSPATMESLEIELTDLLKSIGGKPVSIAMLPGLYANKYGKVLEGDGYLTESRRQGKSGYNLTKFLARLNRSIQILDDRRHGQHLVVLAENAHRYMGRRNKKSDPGNIVVGSQQIYLTFPAWSNFTEYDVMKYFENFGPVEGVRIPLQQKRMYGFVTFASPETASVVLMKGNPHFICDSRVLVKPYREKIRDPKRINENANTTMMNHSSRYPINDLGLMTKNVAQNDEEHNIFQLQMQLSTITLHEQEEEGSYRLWGYHGLHRNTSGEQARTHLINNYSSSNQESGAIQLPENPFSISCSSVSYS